MAFSFPNEQLLTFVLCAHNSQLLGIFKAISTIIKYTHTHIALHDSNIGIFKIEFAIYFIFHSVKWSRNRMVQFNLDSYRITFYHTRSGVDSSSKYYSTSQKWNINCAKSQKQQWANECELQKRNRQNFCKRSWNLESIYILNSMQISLPCV